MADQESSIVSARLADTLARLQATPDFDVWVDDFGSEVIRDGEAAFLPVERSIPIRHVIEECKRVGHPIGLITESPFPGRYFLGCMGGRHPGATLEQLDNMPPETTVGDVVDMTIWYGAGVAVSISSEVSAPVQMLSLSSAQ